jgi:succinate-semialdehyde dehydrogenase/glutarate-semialdehyde dehydrogenase
MVRTYAPASGELLAEIPAASRDEVERTVKRARKAQEAWAVLPVSERAERVLRVRDTILERADEIVEVIARECGKPRHEALVHEVLTTLDLATYYCKHADEILAPRSISPHLMPHRSCVVQYAPRGVVGVISPWNFPFVIPMGTVLAALLAGNGVVLKPSEVTPLVAKKAKEIYDSTGMPEDLFGVVIGFGATGQALVESGVDQVVFTGGVETGKRVAAACGARLIPCIMELGGKAPLIACADCDVERTARAIVFGGFANSGQACISVERVYAHEDVHDALLTRVRDLVTQLRQGDPSRDYVDVGAIIFPKQIEIAEKHIDDAVRKGAEIVAGGRKKPGPGQFFEPTILAGCNHAMSVMKDEIFGPIVPFQRVAGDEEAIALANDSHLGLNAYVFTKDRARGERIASRIEAGSVVVNDVLSNYATAEAPFGGIKQSGFGRVHGDDELRALSAERVVTSPRIAAPAKDPLWYPYTAKSFHWAERAVKALFARGIARKIASLF